MTIIIQSWRKIRLRKEIFFLKIISISFPKKIRHLFTCRSGPGSSWERRRSERPLPPPAWRRCLGPRWRLIPPPPRWRRRRQTGRPRDPWRGPSSLEEEFKFALEKSMGKTVKSVFFSFSTFVRPCLSFLLACFLFSKYKKRFFSLSYFRKVKYHHDCAQIRKTYNLSN